MKWFIARNIGYAVFVGVQLPLVAAGHPWLGLAANVMFFAGVVSGVWVYRLAGRDDD